MIFNKSTDIPGRHPPDDNFKQGYIAPDVLLKCGNFRSAFLMFSLIFWCFTLIILCQMASHSVNPHLAEKARSINDFFGNTKAFMIGPITLGAAIMYFAYGRKTLMWHNGVIIDNKPVNIVRYQIKRISNRVNIIYLQSTRRLWIIYPVTSQDNRKFADPNILNRELAVNETQLKLLEDKLANSAAIEKRFWFFTKGVVASFLIFVTIVIIAFSDI
ncbi:hypothetical protein DYU05_10310 [Mucilaginibacter terrenus]|uniref:Uncharacterized protein n=1 Tax=Mucilaginibacter terrenus TaxID=2482727 RepID=A0A3E2NY91_9SPHI|nr:hypothetical protein [Mucilaginibacter terrenus]RFZ85952.1 hypothetical protein DYU05_10310 [Mucilaginibacter terrenus]